VSVDVDRVAVPYAGVVSRGIALAADVVLATIVTTVLSVVVRLFFEAIGYNTSGTSHAGAIAFVLSLPVAFAIYCTAFWALVGRTPGMTMMGVHVVDTRMRRPGVVRSFVRVVCYAVSAILFIGFVWAAFDARRQAFHDKIARTFVLYDA
jgi:uncharacterized RDD family membrane protein YckC